MTGAKLHHPLSDDQLAPVMAKLVAVRVPFEYAPTDRAGWHRVTVDRRHWPTLETIVTQVAFRPRS